MIEQRVSLIHEIKRENRSSFLFILKLPNYFGPIPELESPFISLWVGFS